MRPSKRLSVGQLAATLACVLAASCAATSDIDQTADDAPIGTPITGQTPPTRGSTGPLTAPTKNPPDDGDPDSTDDDTTSSPNATTPPPATDNNATTPSNPTSGTPTQTAGCPLGQQTNGNTGGPSICCSGSYIVCDDFEAQANGGEPNKAYWMVEKIKGGSLPQTGTAVNSDAGAVVEVSTLRAARGKKSLHIKVPNDGGHHDSLLNRNAFPMPNNSFWGRAFIYYVSDGQSAVPNIHVNYASASGTVKGSSTFYNWTRLATFNNPSNPTMGINYGRGDTAVYSSAHMPTNQWACLEWQYDGTANNRVALYLDGTFLTATTKAIVSQDNPGNVAPTYDAFRLGYEIYQRSGTNPYFEVFFDEVALSATRIGCAN